MAWKSRYAFLETVLLWFYDDAAGICDGYRQQDRLISCTERSWMKISQTHSERRCPFVLVYAALRPFLQASETHGNGLFVKKDFSAAGSFIPVPLAGRFEVHDNEEGCWQAVKRDGVPRFLVLPNITPLLSGSEVARPTSALYLVPDKTSPLYYMNSSATDVEKENFAEEIKLKPSRDFKGGLDVKEYLGNPQNCVSFDISVDVAAGTELLAYYKFEEDVDEMSD